MIEPFHAQFVDMVRKGAGFQDIHTGLPESEMTASDLYVQRELERHELHRRSLIPLLVAHGAIGRRVLDVGCSTGGTTAALAMSREIGAAEVVGIDVQPRSVAAAKIRLQGLRIENARAELVVPGPLQQASESFDLVTCVSVLEFVEGDRTQFLQELQRVTKPGGHVYVATPCPWRLYEMHHGLLFGNQRRRKYYAWASTRGAITRALDQCDIVPTDRWIVKQRLPRMVPPIAARLFPWQKLLFRKRG